MAKKQNNESMARARIYGLTLCFLMLVFFSSVKLAVYHSVDRDFASAKLWQPDTTSSQSVQLEDQQQAVLPLLSFLILLAVPVVAFGLIPRSGPVPFAVSRQWLCPSLFLRPPPVA